MYQKTEVLNMKLFIQDDVFDLMMGLPSEHT